MITCPRCTQAFVPVPGYSGTTCPFCRLAIILPPPLQLTSGAGNPLFDSLEEPASSEPQRTPLATRRKNDDNSGRVGVAIAAASCVAVAAIAIVAIVFMATRSEPEAPRRPEVKRLEPKVIVKPPPPQKRLFTEAVERFVAAADRLANIQEQELVIIADHQRNLEKLVDALADIPSPMSNQDREIVFAATRVREDFERIYRDITGRGPVLSRAAEHAAIRRQIGDIKRANSIAQP